MGEEILDIIGKAVGRKGRRLSLCHSNRALRMPVLCDLFQGPFLRRKSLPPRIPLGVHTLGACRVLPSLYQPTL